MNLSGCVSSDAVLCTILPLYSPPVLAVCVVLLAPLLQGQDEEKEQDPGWYMGEELPEVDLEGKY